MRLRRYNVALIVIPILIFSLGFVSLFSTVPARAKSQVLFFIVGIFLYGVVSILDYELYKIFWKPLYLGILVFLIITAVVGASRGGSMRWLDFGFFVLQPSEFAKTILLLFLAVLLSQKQSRINLMYAGKLFILVLPLFILIILQPDLGTGLILLGTFLGLLLSAGVNLYYFASAFILFGIFSAPFWHFLKPYQQDRILVFLNPSLDTLGSGYNVIQSIIAVGSGGFWGKGFGRGTQSHLKFLPAFWTDFIFAAFAEEWGFLGVASLLCLFCLLCLSLLYVALHATDLLGKLICIGVFLVVFLQFTINVGMNLGLLPVTGIPLPLVSYGGSSLLSSMVMLGMVQSVWYHRKA